MKPFTISEVRDVFAADLGRIQSEVMSVLLQALAQPTERHDLSIARRHAHTLKGMASLVRAEALTRWGADLEELFFRAGGPENTTSTQSEGILRWIADSTLAWASLSEATVAENFPLADNLYNGLRRSISELLGFLGQPPLPPPYDLPQPDVTGSRTDADQEKQTGTVSRSHSPPALQPPAFKSVKTERLAPPSNKMGGSPEIHPPTIKTPTFKSPSRPPFMPPMVAPTTSGLRPNAMAGLPLAAPKFKSAAKPSVAPSMESLTAIPNPNPARSSEVPAQAATARRPEAPQPASTDSTLAAKTSVRSRKDRSREMLAAFALDAQDQLEVLEQAILGLEKKEGTSQQLTLTRRCFHTMKGAANSVGFTELGKDFHAVEDYIEATSSTSESDLPKHFASFLLACVDDLRRHMQSAESGGSDQWSSQWVDRIQCLKAGKELSLNPSKEVSVDSGPRTNDPSASASGDDLQTIRVDSSRLRNLIILMGELVVDRNRLERHLAKLSSEHDQLAESRHRLWQMVTEFQKEFEFSMVHRQSRNLPPEVLPGGRDTSEPGERDVSGFSALEFDRYDRFSVLTRQLLEVTNDLDELVLEMRETHKQFLINHQKFSQTSIKMQEEATGLSLLPIATLFKRLTRVFRDATQTEGKDADLIFEGGHSLLDKTVMDTMYAPMLHLIRNAVAHGLESGQERSASGKPPKGTVYVRAYAAGNHVIVEVQDDGKGIDPALVRRRAIARGLITADASDPLPLEQVVNLLFTEGFSTAEQVTSLSGRGVGLDVVRAEVESVGGNVQVASEPGIGSTWSMRLPLSLNVAQAILGSVGGRPFALPVNFIERGLVVTPEEIHKSETGQEVYAIDGEAYPVVHLADLLGIPDRPTTPHGLVLKSGVQKALLLLEPGFKNQEIVVKPLDSLIGRHPFLSGATIDGEGNVLFILNAPGILQHAVSRKFADRSTQRKAGASRARLSHRRTEKPKVLVVDDSLSVRKVQQRILTDLGCEVITANDGLQALEKLREQSFHLIITDLEMPTMDGYQLITETRNLPRHKLTPMVVVSSRSTARYTDRALALGANTFLAKPFTEEHIDAVIDQYVRLHSSETIAA